MRHQKDLSGRIAPPVAATLSAQRSMAAWIWGRSELPGESTDWAACTISVSSTKLKQDAVTSVADNGSTMDSPKPAETIMEIRTALIITQIIGLAPLPWPHPWKGMVESNVKVSIESLKPVRTRWVAFCKVLNKDWIGLQGNPQRRRQAVAT
jgi:hypothetical protein